MRRVLLPRSKREVVKAVTDVLEAIMGTEGGWETNYVWVVKVGSRQYRDVIVARDEEQLQRAIVACNFKVVSITRHEEPSTTRQKKRAYDKAYQKDRRAAAKATGPIPTAPAPAPTAVPAPPPGL